MVMLSCDVSKDTCMNIHEAPAVYSAGESFYKLTIVTLHVYITWMNQSQDVPLYFEMLIGRQSSKQNWQTLHNFTLMYYLLVLKPVGRSWLHFVKTFCLVFMEMIFPSGKMHWKLNFYASVKSSWIHLFSGTEKFQNSQNHVEEHPLEVTYYCAKIKDQVSFFKDNLLNLGFFVFVFF